MSSLSKWLLGILAVVIVVGAVIFFTGKGDLLTGNYLRSNRGGNPGQNSTNSSNGETAGQTNTNQIVTNSGVTATAAISTNTGVNNGNSNLTTGTKKTLNEKFQEILSAKKDIIAKTGNKPVENTADEEACPYSSWTLVTKLAANGNLLKGTFEDLDTAAKQGCEFKITEGYEELNFRNTYLCERIAIFNTVGMEGLDEKDYSRAFECATNTYVDRSLFGSVTEPKSKIFDYMIVSTNPEISYKEITYSNGGTSEKDLSLTLPLTNAEATFSIYAGN